jgi:hypothetical protein
LGDAEFYRRSGGAAVAETLAGRWILTPGGIHSIVAQLLMDVKAEARCILGGRHWVMTGSHDDVRVYRDGVPAGTGLPLQVDLPAAGPPLPQVIEQTAAADRSEPLCTRAIGFTGDAGGGLIDVTIDSYNALPMIVAPPSPLDYSHS